MIQLAWTFPGVAPSPMVKQFTSTHDGYSFMSKNDYLNSLLVGAWEKIVVQSGRLEYSPSKVVYLLSGIWIYCLSRWVEISATRINEDDFRLSVSVLELPPIPEPSRLNNPPRQLLQSFPADCRLDKFVDGCVADVSASSKNMDDEILIDSSLTVESIDGYKIEIKVSGKFPGSIELKSL